MTINILSIFSSISGEFGQFPQGMPVTFIRFAGCNLRCNHCDTEHSINAVGTKMKLEEIIKKVDELGIRRVVITGGEPMIQKNELKALLIFLEYEGFETAVETNGSIPIKDLYSFANSWIVDIKMPDSGMFDKMLNIAEFTSLGLNIFLKFPINSQEDFIVARGYVRLFDLEPDMTALSPVSPTMTADKLWDLMCEHRLFNCVLNTQIHKYIWPNSKIER